MRQVFRDHFDPEYVLADYQPLHPPEKIREPVAGSLEPTKFEKLLKKFVKVRKFGGLAYTVAALNSVLVGALAGAWTYSWHPLRIGGGAFLLSGVAHWIFINIHDWRGKQQLKGDGITHAGGVVFRRKDARVEYLIVRPKKNELEWVLPKGHIKPDETAADAARREVKEETGVSAKILRRLGTVSFFVGSENIRAEFFLMESYAEGCSAEARRKEWVGYEHALRELTHNQSRAMLKRARDANEVSSEQ